MSKRIQNIALQVRHAIRPAEEGSDLTLGRIGLLIHHACEAHSKLGLRTGASHKVLARLAAAAVQQVEVRESLIVVHEESAELYRQAYPEFSEGDHGCPPFHNSIIETPGSPAIRIVA